MAGLRGGGKGGGLSRGSEGGGLGVLAEVAGLAAVRVARAAGWETVRGEGGGLGSSSGEGGGMGGRYGRGGRSGGLGRRREGGGCGVLGSGGNGGGVGGLGGKGGGDEGLGGGSDRGLTRLAASRINFPNQPHQQPVLYRFARLSFSIVPHMVAPQGGQLQLMLATTGGGH